MRQHPYPSDSESSFATGISLYRKVYQPQHNTTQGFYDKYKSSADLIHRKKNMAVGVKIMSGTFTGGNKNDVNRAVNRCRSGGCVAPAKKGYTTA